MASSSTESKRSDTDDTNTIESNSSDCNKPKFKFPSAPRLCKSANDTSCSCQSDSSVSDGQIVKWKKRSRKKPAKLFPPIGVFWDIENCHVPKNKSASSIVQKIRELFFTGYREAEFIVVCDVRKENAQVIQDLHDAQVNLIHVSSISKNAADEKLRQSLRRFAETYSAPAAVVLISSDINFASDLSDLQYRKKIHVILVHNANVADALKLCANETCLYSHLTENLPLLKNKVTSQYEILISNMPVNYGKNKLKNRLKLLSDNCGGRVVNIDSDKGTAVLKFSSLDLAIRAQRRLYGEDVYGYEIQVSKPTTSRDSPSRNYTGRKPKSVDHPPTNTSGIESPIYYANNQNSVQDVWKPTQNQSIQTNIASNDNFFRAIRDVSVAMPEGGTMSDGSSSVMSESSSGPPIAPTFRYNIPRVEGRTSGPSAPPRRSPTEQNKNPERSQSNSPIDLVITNFDHFIDPTELPKIVTNLLKNYVTILDLNVQLQAENHPIVIVTVANHQEAEMAISCVHRYKLGYKKLVISYAHSSSSLDKVQLQEMIIALLKDVPGNRMPLFRLIGLLESRYHAQVSVYEITQLKNMCEITDETNGRFVTLTSNAWAPTPFNLSTTSILYCLVHCPNGLENRGWGEVDCDLPNILMPLKLFSEKVNQLLSTHADTLPLLSFPICYKAQFKEELPVHENGVPLEHLITCVKNVELKLGGPKRTIKYVRKEIKMSLTDKTEAVLRSSSPSICANLQTLCRELCELLKNTERSQVPFPRLIPTYHHHFGKQCRVGNYGHTKLIDLLQSQVISSVIQILGYGSRRVIALTHTAQMRRFTSDLLKILRGQVSKQLTSEEFPAAYEKVMGKCFNAIEYGLCSLEDLLSEVSDNTLVINERNGIAEIAIPKRNQTDEQIARTKQFAIEAEQLLRHTPEFAMSLIKFVEAYHHQFGHQCRLADYGYTKMTELFEAIPDTVRIEEMSDGEKGVSLTLPRAFKALGEQIADLIKHSRMRYIPLESLPSTYLREHGYSLKPQSYHCQNYNELILKLGDYVRVTQSGLGPLLDLADPEGDAVISMRIWGLLLEPPHCLPASRLSVKYKIKFPDNIITFSKLQQLGEVINVTTPDRTVSLTPLYLLAAELYHILYLYGGQARFSELENLYRRNYKKEISYTNLNLNSFGDLISEMSFMLVIRSSRKKTNVMLNLKLAEYGIPLPFAAPNRAYEDGKIEESSLKLFVPTHELYQSPRYRKFRIVPPKPDTPATPRSALWFEMNSPSKLINNAFGTPDAEKIMKQFSPSDFNFFEYGNEPIALPDSTITAPHPTEVPMPDRLLGKDDSNDSGVVTNSHIAFSEGEMDVSAERTGAIPKRGLHFSYFKNN